MNSSSSNNTGLIAGIIIITIALFAGLVFLLTRLPADSGTNGNENVTFTDTLNPSIGPANAKVVVRMYEDFECPACAASYPIVKQVIETYKDRIRFVWKDFPLETIHPVARPSANAARCAQAQGKFWEYQEQLFLIRGWVAASNKTDAFVTLAKSVVGLDQAAFKTCIESKAQDGLVASDIREGFSNKVNATPTFFVNQKRYFGMQFADWKRTLDAELVKADAAVAEAALTSETVPAIATSTSR